MLLMINIFAKCTRSDPLNMLCFILVIYFSFFLSLFILAKKVQSRFFFIRIVHYVCPTAAYPPRVHLYKVLLKNDRFPILCPISSNKRDLKKRKKKKKKHLQTFSSKVLTLTCSSECKLPEKINF